jgi:hypothetical protein
VKKTLISFLCTLRIPTPSLVFWVSRKKRLTFFKRPKLGHNGLYLSRMILCSMKNGVLSLVELAFFMKRLSSFDEFLRQFFFFFFGALIFA